MLARLFRRDDPSDVEKRASWAAGYTEGRLQADWAAVSGNVADVAATAAAEFAVGLIGRCLAGSTPTPATPALTPAVMQSIGRALSLTGEWVAQIDVVLDGAIRLYQCCGYDIVGNSPNPDAWTYRLDIAAPSDIVSLLRPAPGVVHIRVNAAPVAPWKGVSPLTNAGLTARQLTMISQRLAEESGARVGYLLPIPDGMEEEETEDLRADLKSMAGQVALIETTSSGHGQGRSGAPAQDWIPRRFGPMIPATSLEAARDASMGVLTALGIPPGLWANSDGTALRESYRQLIQYTITPTLEIVAAELAAKLEIPGLRFSTRRLAAADVAGRARAYASLKGAQMDDADAREIAGLNE